MEIVDTVVESCIHILSQAGPMAGILLILLESVFPVLPLSVFITLNLMTFGSILGYFLSLGATIVGCTCSFFFFRQVFSHRLYRLVERKDYIEVKKWMVKITKIKFTNLVILIALPFTPAFLINIAAGLSHLSFRKYFFSLLIGKAVMVYFWGYVGTSLLESLTDFSVLLKIIILLLFAYIASKVIEKSAEI